MPISYECETIHDWEDQNKEYGVECNSCGASFGSDRIEYKNNLPICPQCGAVLKSEIDCSDCKNDECQGCKD
jgi:hypothetical protein